MTSFIKEIERRTIAAVQKTKGLNFNLSCYEGAASLEDAFVSWANNNLKDIESVKNAWDAINNELRTIFAMGEPTAPITDPAQAPESSDNTLMSMLKDDDNQTANPVTTPPVSTGV